jgi:hypothetical protein
MVIAGAATIDIGTSTEAARRGAARMALRWPRARPALLKCLPADSRLADLCETYETTCAAAEYWRRSEAQVGPSRVEEYMQLAADLEADILDALI